jgi:hypothetical protein
MYNSYQSSFFFNSVSQQQQNKRKRMLLPLLSCYSYCYKSLPLSWQLSVIKYSTINHSATVSAEFWYALFNSLVSNPVLVEILNDQ